MYLCCSHANSLPPCKKQDSTTVTSNGKPGSTPAHKKTHSPQHSHHHHRHHHSAVNKHNEEVGVCGNKFIQVTVVILVLVMAFWWGLQHWLGSSHFISFGGAGSLPWKCTFFPCLYKNKLFPTFFLLTCTHNPKKQTPFLWSMLETNIFIYGKSSCHPPLIANDCSSSSRR